MGYLSDGDTVSITVSSSDADWQAREEAQVRAQLEERYGETIVIRLGSDPAPEVTPPQSRPAGGRHPGDAAGSLRTTAPTTMTRTTAPTRTAITDYDDTDYGPNTDGVTRL